MSAEHHQKNQAPFQYKDLVVHCKRQPYDVYVGRRSRGAPSGDLCQWGNPFTMKNPSQEERNRVVHEYRCWLVSQPELVAKAQKELKGKVLACWCSPKLCHGHVLAEIANATLYAVGQQETKEEVKEVAKEECTWSPDDGEFPALGAALEKVPRAVKKVISLTAQKQDTVGATRAQKRNNKTQTNRKQ